jgi:hypothetical protein
MLKPTVRNLYQLMSVQAELHDPISLYWYSPARGNVFLVVKTSGTFRIDQLPTDNAYVLRIIKNCVVQAYANIPQFDETRVYKSGIRITD